MRGAQCILDATFPKVGGGGSRLEAEAVKHFHVDMHPLLLF